MSKICMATGGTGGHIYPALTLADIYKEKIPGTEVFFVGNDDRMEATIVPEAGYPFFSLHSSGLEGSVWHKLNALAQQAKAYYDARTILKKQQPDLVIGFGGYVSAPVLSAAQHLGIPTVIHEQNSVVGKANKLVMNKADAIVTCYEKAEEVFGPKAKLLGNPRATLAAQIRLDQDYYDKLGLDPDKKTILVMMGSLGSSSINELMKTSLKGIEDGLQFIYVCGKANDSDLNLFDGQENIHVVDYIDTSRIYPKIDGMICRAGATTLAEVTALGIPSILIPSPYVANNHQFYNASMLVKEGAADLIEEKDLNAGTLKKHIQDLFLDEEKMKEMSREALAMGKPNAAYDIIDLCEQIIKGDSPDGKPAF